MNRLGKTITGLYKWSVAAIAFAVAIYVLVLNFISTAYVTADSYELNYYVSDNILRNIIGIVLFFFFGKLLNDKTNFVSWISSLDYKKTRKILLIVIGAMGFFWAMSSRMGARVDQLYVQQAVYSGLWGNYESFMPSGYMDLYPNQAGLFILSTVISKLFGSYNYPIFGLINSFCLALSYKELLDILDSFKIKDTTKIFVLISGIIFTPYIMYAAFVYGTIIGMYFALLSMRLMVSYLNEDRRKIKAVLSLVFMSLAILSKSNYLIFMVALVIYSLVKILSSKDRKYIDIIWVLGLIVTYFVATAVPVFVLQKTTGKDFNQGASSWSWIAMGMQENSQNYAGGFNGFNEDSYRFSNYDKKAQAEISKEEIKNSLENFKNNPTYALNFYTRKALHQWADPTYKSYFITQALQRDADISPLAFFLMKPQTQYAYTTVLDLFQMLIYIGVAAFIWSYRKHENFADLLIFPMTFVGGFLFHIIWEGKSEYTLSYFVLLIPIGILGLGKIITGLKPIDLKKINSQKLNLDISFVFILLALILLFGEILGLGTLKEQFVQDKALYNQYLKEGYKNTWGALDTGIYKLKSEDRDYYLGGDDISLEIVTNNGISRVRIKDTDLYLTVHFMGNKKSNLGFEKYLPGDTQEFKILDGGQDKVYILYGEHYVLLLNDDIELKAQYGNDHINYRTPEANELWDVSEG